MWLELPRTRHDKQLARRFITHNVFVVVTQVHQRTQLILRRRTMRMMRMRMMRMRNKLWFHNILDTVDLWTVCLGFIAVRLYDNRMKLV